MKLRASSPLGPVTNPTYSPDGATISYRVHAAGQASLVVCTWVTDRCRSFSGGSNYVSRLENDSLFFVRITPSASYELVAASLPDGKIVQLFPGDDLRTDSSTTEAFGAQSDDGLSLPAFHWGARRTTNRAAAAVILVPGGGRAQPEFVTTSRIRFLTEHGIDVIGMAFRGKNGFGVAFRDAPGGDAAAAKDILAVRDEVSRRLGIPRERIALLGDSEGAYVILRAASLDERTGPIVLTSVLGPEPSSPAAHKHCAIAFHGSRDRDITAAIARKRIDHWIGSGATDEPCGHFEVLAGETRAFSSKARGQVLAAVVKALP